MSITLLSSSLKTPSNFSSTVLLPVLAKNQLFLNRLLQTVAGSTTPRTKAIVTTALTGSSPHSINQGVVTGSSTQEIYPREFEYDTAQINRSSKRNSLCKHLTKWTYQTVVPKDETKHDVKPRYLTYSVIRSLTALTAVPNIVNTQNDLIVNQMKTTQNSLQTTSRYCYSTDSRKITDNVDSWETLVDYDRLSPMEKQIHNRHRDAVRQRKLTYVDPLTGYQVMTRFAHTERGECCGNACRHCPFGQVNVVDEKYKKSFNSAFYV